MERYTFDDPAGLLKERMQLMNDTVRGDKKPKRIPICSQSRAFPLLDAGYSLLEAFCDYDKTYDAMARFQELYNYDFYTDYSRFSYLVTEALGGGGMVVDDEKGTINYVDELLLLDGEYDDLIEMGMDRFFFERVLPRKYGLGKGKTTEEALAMINKAMEEQHKLDAANAKMVKNFKEKYGLGKTTNASPCFYKTPVDVIECNLRGLKKFALDMRKLPKEKLLKALEVCDNGQLDAVLKKLENVDRTADDISFHAATTSTTSWQLSAKQYEMLDWPYISKLFDKVVETDSLCLIFPEGGFKHLIDFYRDLPKGHFAIIAETDDMETLKYLKKELPNVALLGGMPSYYLGHMSKEVCIDKAKEVVDELGYDGRLIFSTDKMLSTKSDANGENLRAVNDFVREYGRFGK